MMHLRATLLFLCLPVLAIRDSSRASFLKVDNLRGANLELAPPELISSAGEEAKSVKVAGDENDVPAAQRQTGQLEAQPLEGEKGLPEAEEEAWAMNFEEKVLLEVGWLFGFMLLIFVLIVFMSVISLLRDSSKDVDDGPAVPPLLSQKAYWFEVHVMDPLVIGSGLVNFVVFAAASELQHEPEAMTGFGLRIPLKTWVPAANEIGQLCGSCILLVGLLVRVASAAAHPWWQQYRALAPLVGLLLNLYAWVDIMAVTPTLLDLLQPRELYYNIQAVCLIRLVEMAMRTPSSTGAGMKAFIDSFDEDGPLIRTIFALALVIWIFFSGLYMVANRLNPQTVWKAAEYEGIKWQRFESLPSSMFFTLLNLCKEHPLAEKFGAEGNAAAVAFFQRLNVVVVCIVGVPVFGVPTGILGASLMKHCRKEVERMEALEDVAVQDDPQEPPTPHFERHRLLYLISTMLLAFGSTFVYFFFTLGEETRMFLLPVPKVSRFTLAIVDLVTSSIFLVELIARAFLGGKSYLRALPHFVIDLAAVLPPMLAGTLLLSKGHAPEWLQGLCVLWVLKPERYIGAFASMSRILWENAAILKATALTSFLLWLLVSSLLHFTERNNPDDELQENYASVPRALWAEIINLHGEWPWCDYTWQGKAIGTFLNFVSIGICMVPVVVFSEAFIRQAVGGTKAPTAAPQAFTIEDLAQHRWQLRYKENKGFKALYSHLLSEEMNSTPGVYYVLRAVSTLLILLSTVSTIMSSLSGLSWKACAAGSEWSYCEETWWFFVGTDMSLTIFFTVEFLARVIILRGSYLISFIGIVDLISLHAFIGTSFFLATRDDAMHPKYISEGFQDGLLELALLLRLMRLLMLESWSPAIQSLCDVVWMRGPALRKACYALVAVWYVFTVCLYVLEKDSGLECSERFANVLVGLPHGLIHLTGDYPCTEYTTIAMPFHLVFLILGMCCTGTFTGIFASGFVEYLGATRRMQRETAKEERLRVMAMAVCVLQRRFRLRRQRAGEAPRRLELTMSRAARRILRRHTSLGRVFMSLAQTALVVNIFNTMLESMPEIEALSGEVRSCLTFVELVTGIVFCIEFLLHVVSKPIGIFTTPMRLIDFLCLLPTFMRLRFQLQSEDLQLNRRGQALEAFIECCAACRVVRVLDWPQIRREVLAVKQTLKTALPSLAMPAVISLQLWVLTAGIFVWMENLYHLKGEPSDQEQMATIPDALYWCSIYLLGEWANDEFTDGAGSRMCIFYCLCGVALFSIPVGIMVEAGRATLEKVADEKKELAELKAAAAARKGVKAL